MIKVLGVKANFQIQYQLSFCLWVLTFNPTIAEKLNAYGVIPVLSDILADAQKEKVSRIILAVFRVSVLKFFFYTLCIPNFEVNKKKGIKCNPIDILFLSTPCHTT